MLFRREGKLSVDYVKSVVDCRRFTSEYCMFLRGNILMEERKKNVVLFGRSIIATYDACQCEGLWMKMILDDH